MISYLRQNAKTVYNTTSGFSHNDGIGIGQHFFSGSSLMEQDTTSAPKPKAVLNSATLNALGNLWQKLTH